MRSRRPSRDLPLSEGRRRSSASLCVDDRSGLDPFNRELRRGRCEHPCSPAEALPCLWRHQADLLGEATAAGDRRGARQVAHRAPCTLLELRAHPHDPAGLSVPRPGLPGGNDTRGSRCGLHTQARSERHRTQAWASQVDRVALDRPLQIGRSRHLPSPRLPVPHALSRRATACRRWRSRLPCARARPLSVRRDVREAG